VEQPFFRSVVGGEFGWKELECNCAAEFGVFSLVNDAHAAGAELGDNLVMEDGSADHGKMIRHR
jgi:hypothetical protein